MNKWTRRGFTLIEVSLFLAITGLLFIGIVAGTQNSIYQQRFNDSVQNFAEFLRGTYAQVVNVQSLGNGNSADVFVYGKLITFGDSAENDINIYTVYGGEKNGDEECAGKGNTLDALGCAGIKTNPTDGISSFVDKYEPKWGAKIDNRDGNLFSGEILIVRSPISGRVVTYYNASNTSSSETIMTGADFKEQDVDFCVSPDGGSEKRNVRIKAGASSASGVEIISDSDSENACK